MSVGEVVWSVRISHKHGNDINVYSSEEAAWRGVADYARYNWDTALESAEENGSAIPATPPDDDSKVIDLYFDTAMAEEEFYEVESKVIG